MTKRRAGRPRKHDVLTEFVSIPVTHEMKAQLEEICEQTGIRNVRALGRLFFASGLACWQAERRLPSFSGEAA